MEDAAVTATGAVGDADLGIRGRLVGAQGRHPHGPGHGAGEQQDVGVTGGGDHLDAEPLGIEQRGDGGEDLDLAGVAAAAVHPIDIGRAANVLEQGLLETGDLRILCQRHGASMGIADNGFYAFDLAHHIDSCWVSVAAPDAGWLSMLCLRLQSGQWCNRCGWASGWAACARVSSTSATSRAGAK
ncbi:hypothetical protein D3C72_1484710 [compost metagenome]